MEKYEIGDFDVAIRVVATEDGPLRDAPVELWLVNQEGDVNIFLGVGDTLHKASIDAEYELNRIGLTFLRNEDVEVEQKEGELKW